MTTCTVEGCSNHVRAKGLCNAHWLRQRRHGHTGALRRASGEGTVRPDRRRMVTVGGDQVREHIAVAEKALGHALPAGAQVHHVDYDPSHNSNTNLVVCPDDRYHKLLHVRTDALNACGNADWRKCGLCKQYDSPENLSRHGTRESFYHRRCAAAYQRNRSQR